MLEEHKVKENVGPCKYKCSRNDYSRAQVKCEEKCSNLNSCHELNLIGRGKSKSN